MKTRSWDWGKIVPMAAMLTLSFGASVGVYVIMRQFAGPIVSAINASSFELTYLGLALADKNTAKARQLATNVSIGAVIVSILMNVSAGLLIKYPALAGSTNIAWVIYLAVLHGVPLALLAYFMAALIIHKDGTTFETLAAKIAELEAFLLGMTTEKDTALTAQADAEAQIGRAGAQVAQLEAYLLDEITKKDTALALAAAAEAQTSAVLAEIEAQASMTTELTIREVGNAAKRNGWQLSDFVAASVAAHRGDKAAAAKALGLKVAQVTAWADKGRI